MIEVFIAVFVGALAWIAWLLRPRKEQTDEEALAEVLRRVKAGESETDLPDELLEKADRAAYQQRMREGKR